MRLIPLRASRAALLLALLLSACDDTGPRLVPTTVQLSQTAVALADADSVRLSATVLDQNGAPMQTLPAGVTLVWSSTAPAVATVADGLVRAARPGTARIIAQAGEAVGGADVTVRAVPTELRIAAGDGQRGTVAAALGDSAAVRVVDRHGDGVAGVAVAFSVTNGGGAVSAASVVTGAEGRAGVAWTLGTQAGEQAITAQVNGLPPVGFRATAVAGAPGEVRRVGGDAQSAPAGTELPTRLTVRVLDGYGNPVRGVEVAWAATAGGSVAPARVVTDTTGQAQTSWTLGAAAGTQSATATVGSLPAAVFAATATSASGPPAPVITDVAPALLTPGVTATISGRNFSGTAADNAVSVAGVSASVLEATATRLTVRIPARSLLPCQPTGNAPVVVRVGEANGSRSHPLQVATAVQLNVGQMINIANDEVRCTGLPQTGGRYMISVLNTSTSVGGSAALTLRSTGAASTAAPVASRAPASAPQPRTAAQGNDGGEHMRILEANLALARSLAPRLRPTDQVRRSLVRAAIPTVGDTLSFRIPNIGGSNLCSTFTEVRARAVYSGTRAVVFEDVAAPLGGQMDSLYRAVGREYDTSMHDILTANFGDPLAMDRLTDNNGRIFMLFSKVVSDDAPNVAGFVFSGDFFDRTRCASSNQAEVFYARVPTSTAAGFSSDTRDGWLRSMRSTVIHEVKHITSFAARLANNASSWEASWLEESTARVSEELWARSWFGHTHKGNVRYQQSIHCEVRPTASDCVGTPLVMFKHYVGLYDFLRSGGRLSPLGSAGSGESSFYGSGWSLVRWAMDQSSLSESAFLRALTQEAQLSGVRSLEARTGRSFADLLADWSMAMALDDRPGFTPPRAALHFPGWATRDVYEGMNRDFPNSFTAPFAPLVLQLSYGGFTAEIPQLRGGSAALFELSGTPAAPPVLELRGPSGAAPAATVRMAILRLQ